VAALDPFADPVGAEPDELRRPVGTVGNRLLVALLVELLHQVSWYRWGAVGAASVCAVERLGPVDDQSLGVGGGDLSHELQASGAGLRDLRIDCHPDSEDEIIGTQRSPIVPL